MVYKGFEERQEHKTKLGVKIMKKGQMQIALAPGLSLWEGMDRFQKNPLLGFARSIHG